MDLLPVKYKDKADKFEKGNLVFDSWFEAGCSWYAILCKRIHEKRFMIDIDKEGQPKLLFSSGPELVGMEEEGSEVSCVETVVTICA